MKNLILLLLIFFAAQLHAQGTQFEPLKLNDNNRLFFDVIHEDKDLSKEEFFNRSKRWIAKDFTNSKEVEGFADVEDGIIIGKGSIPIERDLLSALGGSQDYVQFTINIYCKDGKARIVLDDIGTFTLGNEYINPNDITPLEHQFWLNGDPSDVQLKGFKKDKLKKINAVVSVVNSWEEGLIEEKTNYSDF